MKRTDVYKLIDGEREYQEAMSQHQDKMQQANTPVASWLLYMWEHLKRANLAVYNLNEQGALEQVRKVTALGVACMEHNKTTAR